ncbi:hypothetical protein Q75_09770 [Bacillus coahuilensis p1.1.43]|uniref:Uncharacterized protein n=1 Tax=Bacillus coahuilensis p1.1.43 TaxID=1150625 RepID=A0A147K7A6_9BACI|nr:hypothetical protein [Bacillus coahuilensis]KUP05947.1 hypothetical protein Q75_09770 [Bacillus coahuilensis p1.1.43]
MRKQILLAFLSLVVAILAIISTSIGLFYSTDGEPFEFITLHGDSITMYGRGIYAFDSFFKVPILRGTDAIILFVVVPYVLLNSFLYMKHSSQINLLFLLSGLFSILYYATSITFGVHFNSLYLVYILIFSASLIGFVWGSSFVDFPLLTKEVSSKYPYRGVVIFLFIAGCSVFIWLVEIIGALATNEIPFGAIGYTTDITTVLDLGVIAPLSFITCYLLVKRKPIAFLFASNLVTLSGFIGLMVIAQTVAQALEGIILPVGQYVGFVGTFVMLSLFAFSLTIRMYKAFGNNSEQV